MMWLVIFCFREESVGGIEFLKSMKNIYLLQAKISWFYKTKKHLNLLNQVMHLVRLNFVQSETFEGFL